jgi:DHA2 family multidrug resistance protein-like MFS transporter
MSAPIHRAGSASTMGATGRLLGQASGAALVASLFRLLPDDARQASLLLAALIAVSALVASAARGFRFETESFE